MTRARWPSSASRRASGTSSPSPSTWCSATTCQTATSSLTRWRATMPKPSDVVEALRVLGFCASDEALRAMLEQLTKARASPVEACEKLAQLERRGRDPRDLARRTPPAPPRSVTNPPRLPADNPQAPAPAGDEEPRDGAPP